MPREPTSNLSALSPVLVSLVLQHLQDTGTGENLGGSELLESTGRQRGAPEIEIYSVGPFSILSTAHSWQAGNFFPFPILSKAPSTAVSKPLWPSNAWPIRCLLGWIRGWMLHEWPGSSRQSLQIFFISIWLIFCKTFWHIEPTGWLYHIMQVPQNTERPHRIFKSV